MARKKSFFNQRRKNTLNPSSPYTPPPRMGMGMDRGSRSSGFDKKSRLQQIVEAETIKRTQGISGKDPKTGRMIPVGGADSPAAADRFIRENPKDFVRISPAVLEDRKRSPQYADVEGDTRVNKNLPKQFMDTAEGRKYFTPMAKGDLRAKYVPEFGTYGSLSAAEEIPEEGVRDIRPKFTDPKTGKTVFTNPRAEEHRNFAAKIREKGAGYWNRPENARELANLLNEAPSKGLTSAQVMRYIDKQDKQAAYEKDSAEGMDFVQGVVRSETGSDPADIAFSRKRAYPDQGKNSKLLKKMKKQKRRFKGKGKGKDKRSTLPGFVPGNPVKPNSNKGKRRGDTSALRDAFKNLPRNLQEELIKNNPIFSTFASSIIPAPRK